MKSAISETQRRRQIQLAYNTEHDIDPQTIRRRVSDILLSLGGDTDGRADAEEGAARSARRIRRCPPTSSNG